MYTKDDKIYSLYELKMAYPNESFMSSGPNDQWLADNGFTRYVPPAPPAPDPAEVAAAQKAATIKALVDAVQTFMDEKARERNYDDIVSACSYAAAPNVFQAESQAYLAWRAAAWKKCYDVMAEVEAGTMVMPEYVFGDPESITPKQWLLNQLPELVLP